MQHTAAMHEAGVRRFHQTQLVSYVVPRRVAAAGMIPGEVRSWHDITAHHDVKARRHDALTVTVPALTLTVQLQEAHLSKERVAKPPV
jgi:hypothetical protein